MQKGWICDLCKKFYLTKEEADECERNHPEIMTAYTIDVSADTSKLLLTIHTEKQIYRFLTKVPEERIKK